MSWETTPSASALSNCKTASSSLAGVGVSVPLGRGEGMLAGTLGTSGGLQADANMATTTQVASSVLFTFPKASLFGSIIPYSAGMSNLRGCRATDTSCGSNIQDVTTLTREDEAVTANVIFLSPHLDDAALSCGGLIARLIPDGAEVLVITVFAGFPARREPSALAAQLHARWGDPADPVVLRRNEDKKAMELLGADWLHLRYPEAVYRFEEPSFLYLRSRDLFGSPHPSDSAVVAQIAESVMEICHPGQTEIHAPLAIGNHVDHQLVRNAAFILLRRSFRVTFYEDYPYVEVPGALTMALEATDVTRWREEVQYLEEDCLAQKTQAIARYASQMNELFQGAEKMAQRVRDYSRAVSTVGGYAERYWQPSSGMTPEAEK